MADGAVNFLLDKLTTILLQKASLLGDAHDKVEEIKLELESMRSFLKDAERRKEKSESVETWVRQVREVAYEVEDVIDEYMHHKHQDWSGVKCFVPNVIDFPKKITARYQISSKLEKIKNKVHEVSDRSKRYGFCQDDDGRSRNAVGDTLRQFGELSAFVDEDEIVGMEEDMEQLLGWLTEDDPRRTVRSVVGMGGLGKTTLVTSVYNNPIVKKHFDCCAWISVSQMCGTNELIRSMIKEILGNRQIPIPSNMGSMNYRQLVGMLIDYLHQKRYVVVLDDVSSIDLWSRIRCAFPNNRYGSRIILTTRNENVAASVGVGSHIHHLDFLREKDTWALFCKKAFWNVPDHSCPQELQPLAKAIVKKCEGLPLAIVAVGGLMCSRGRNSAEWKKVYESLNWQLSNNPILGRVKGILQMSFNDLPFYLKHCFLYCCIFLDGYPIKRKKLIRLWVAEGFIGERRGMTLEEIAEEYLSELILRNMIQVTDNNDAGRVKMCRVHDVMRELAVTTSEKENFCSAYEGHQTRIDGKVQRLSMYNTGNAIQLSNDVSHHLRTFFVIPTDTCASFSLSAVSSKFRLLRVLNLEGVSLETIPTTLVTLFNLRYLNMRDTNIKELPKSVERLYNLQTLDVRNTYIVKLPNGISKLYNLRHLCMHRRNDKKSERIHFHTSMEVPPGICNIQTLQTLVCIEAEKQLIQQLGNLTDLKRLEITKLEASDGMKLCKAIQRMTGLVHLGITAMTKAEELQLETVSPPPLSLQKLRLVGKLRRVPPWILSLKSLTHLHLGFSCLEEDIASALQALPSLAFLELHTAYDGRSVHMKPGWFPKLNKLILLQLTQLEEMELEEGSLPCIQELHLIRCQQLKMLPQGIKHLTSLQKLHLEEMPEELLQSLQDNEVQENIRHIPTCKLVYLKGETRVVETFCGKSNHNWEQK